MKNNQKKFDFQKWNMINSEYIFISFIEITQPETLVFVLICPELQVFSVYNLKNIFEHFCCNKTLSMITLLKYHSINQQFILNQQNNLVLNKNLKKQKKQQQTIRSFQYRVLWFSLKAFCCFVQEPCYQV